MAERGGAFRVSARHTHAPTRADQPSGPNHHAQGVGQNPQCRTPYSLGSSFGAPKMPPRPPLKPFFLRNPLLLSKNLWRDTSISVRNGGNPLWWPLRPRFGSCPPHGPNNDRIRTKLRNCQRCCYRPVEHGQCDGLVPPLRTDDCGAQIRSRHELSHRRSRSDGLDGPKPVVSSAARNSLCVACTRFSIP